MTTPHSPNTQKLLQIKAIFLRELWSYAHAPMSFLVAIVYLTLMGSATFYLGGFFERDQADLRAMLTYAPYIHLLLVSILMMRSWSEERSSRSIELILTLPTPVSCYVWGKNLAAFALTSLLLACTFPLVITLFILGQPDVTLMLSTYLGLLGFNFALVTLGGFCSAMTRSQVGAFILTFAIGALFLAIQSDAVQAGLSFLPGWLLDIFYRMSLLTHLNHFASGLLSMQDIFFFILFSLTFTLANLIIIELRKAV